MSQKAADRIGEGALVGGAIGGCWGPPGAGAGAVLGAGAGAVNHVHQDAIKPEIPKIEGKVGAGWKRIKKGKLPNI